MARRWLLGIDLGGGGVRCLLVDVGTGETAVGCSNSRRNNGTGSASRGWDFPARCFLKCGPAASCWVN